MFNGRILLRDSETILYGTESDGRDSVELARVHGAALMMLCVGLLAASGCDGAGFASCNGSGTSTSGAEHGPPPGTLLVQMSPKHIYVDDEPVVSLEHGQVAVVDKKYKGGLNILPLHKALEARRKRAEKHQDARGETITRIRLQTHPLTTARILSEVVYTVGEAELGWDTPFEWRVCPVPECSAGEDANGSVVSFTERVRHTHDHEPREDNARPLQLTIRPGRHGIAVATSGGLMPPVDGCPKVGPTLCLKNTNFDVDASLKASRRALDDEDGIEVAMRHDRRVLDAYDYRRLYNLAVEIKEEFPKASKLSIGLNIYDNEPDLPLGLFREVLRHVRVRLPEPKYNTDEAYRAAREQAGEQLGNDERLFDEICPPLGQCWDHAIIDKVMGEPFEDAFQDHNSNAYGLSDSEDDLFGTDAGDPDVDLDETR